MLILRINEILCYYISAHFQSGDIGIKFAAHFRTGKSACMSQFACDEAAFCSQNIQYCIFYTSFLWIWINTPSIIAKIRPPFTTDKCSLAFEKFAVCATAFLQNRTFPLPKRPFPSSIRQTVVLAIFVHNLICRPTYNTHR